MILCLKSCLRSSVLKYAKIAFVQKCEHSISIVKFQPRMCFFSRRRQLLKSYSCYNGNLLNEYKFLYSITYHLDRTSNFRLKWNQKQNDQIHLLRHFSDKADKPEVHKSEADEPKTETKPSLVQRFKQMYRDYWYVLVPVHLVTSAFWFASFYYLAESGVDIASLLESIGAGETLVQKLRNGNSTMGYIAIAYALYKIATPLRYTVTLGGTTLSIKYLKDWGYIKPIPPRDKLKEMIHEKKDNLKELYIQKGLTKFRIKKKGGNKE